MPDICCTSSGLIPITIAHEISWDRQLYNTVRVVISIFRFLPFLGDVGFFGFSGFN